MVAPQVNVAFAFVRVPGSATTRPVESESSFVERCALQPPPAFVGSPKQGARPSARLCDGVGSAGRPRAPGRAPETQGRGAQRTRQGADDPRFCPLGQNFAEGPQLRLALAMLDAQASALQAKWGHGVGRHDRQMRGEIVSTCKDLRVRSRSLGVQTGLYRVIVPCRGDLLFHLRKHTVSV